jgi:hypothetical protein
MSDYIKFKKKKLNPIKLLALSVLLATLGSGLGSCGIETYKYLDPVDPGGISMELNTTAYISLPGGQPSYFRYFTIYYRIYISDLPVSGVVDTGILAQINPALYADYSYFYSYTNTSSTMVPTTMGTIFSGRKYFPLELENNPPIENVLGSGGGVVTLDFAANSLFKPALIMDDLRVTPGAPRRQLSRNTRNDNNPYANNYYFMNSDDVNNGDLISSSSDSSRINQDVQNSAQSISGPRYTYVSMYILSYGLDDSNFTNIYSIPTFIGIFLLPDE